MTPRSIGIFDSGIGGLTVMRAISRVSPHIPIVYFGDTARLPYGEKSPEAILRFSRENTAFLEQQSVDIIVIACHTASALALHMLKRECRIPIMGVIEPGVHQAVQVTRHHRIAVLGTRRTIASGIYQRAIHEQLPQAHIVPIACPLFVPLVEEKFSSHTATRLIIREYLAPAVHAQVDTIILGCTHYPLLKSLIQQEVGDDVILVDSAEACASLVGRLLTPQRELLPAHADAMPAHRFFVSDDPDRFRSMGEHILGYAIPNVICCLTS